MQQETMLIGGYAVTITEKIAGNGRAFEAQCPEHGPPQLQTLIAAVAQQWCSEMENSHAGISAKCWTDPGVVHVEAVGDTEVISHSRGALLSGWREIELPMFAAPTLEPAGFVA